MTSPFAYVSEYSSVTLILNLLSIASLATTEAKHHNTTEKYTVDNYIGLSLEAAREAIDNKFKINVTEEYSDTYEKDWSCSKIQKAIRN